VVIHFVKVISMGRFGRSIILALDDDGLRRGVGRAYGDQHQDGEQRVQG
jgi:hypothetical protein